MPFFFQSVLYNDDNSFALGGSNVAIQSLDVMDDKIIYGGDQSSPHTRTDGTNKRGYLVVPHRLNATEENVCAVYVNNGSANNTVSIGNGNGVFNCATVVEIRVAANAASTTGNLRFFVSDVAVSAGAPFGFASYTVATAPTPLGDAQLAYISNGSAGNPCIAVTYGGNWKVLADLTTLSNISAS